MLQYVLRALIYCICFAASWYGMESVRFEKLIKQNHVVQAQLLYILLCASIAWLSGSFLLAFVF